MTQNEEIIKRYKQRFENEQSLTKNDINSIFNEFDVYLSDNALRKHIHRIKEKGVIFSVGKGVYSIEAKPQTPKS